MSEEPENTSILRFLRQLEGGKIYEMVFNWSEEEVDYKTGFDRKISAYHMGPTDGVDKTFSDKVQEGKLPPYGPVILELNSIPGKWLNFYGK